MRFIRPANVRFWRTVCSNTVAPTPQFLARIGCPIADPGYAIKLRSARPFRVRRQPRCPSTSPCFQAWCGPATAGSREDSLSFGRSTWVSSVASNMCRSCTGRDRCLPPNGGRFARTAVLRCVEILVFGWETKNRLLLTLPQ